MAIHLIQLSKTNTFQLWVAIPNSCMDVIVLISRFIGWKKFENKSGIMDLNKCLPPELTIESVDDILYRIGLSFDSIRDRPKRKLFYHPLIA